MTATVNAATILNPSSAASQTTASITVAGNFQLVISMVGNAVHVNSITDTLGNSYTTRFGSFGSSSNTVVSGAFHLSAFYTNNTTAGANAVTVNYSGATGTPTFLFYADCTNIASVSALISDIYNAQSALANGSNVITVSGGTGSDNITSVPALIVTAVRANSGTVSPGSSPVAFTKAAGTGAVMLEYAYTTSTGTFDSTATLTAGSGSSTANTWQFALSAPITQADSKSVAISGNGPGTLTANNACAALDVIMVPFTLSNVAVENSGFVPTISDSVNSGNYNVIYTNYYATGTELIGLAWKVANASGIPTVTLNGSTAYSNGQMSYVRWTGFPQTPTLDGMVQANNGNSSNPTGTLGSQGFNELVAAFTWGGGSYSTNPPGWNLVTGASGGFNVSPYWLVNASPSTANFTGGVLSSSEQWFTALVGISSGPTQSPIGTIRLPGGGPNPHRIQTFIPRQLSNTSPAGFNAAFGGSVAGGYAHGVPQGIVGGYGGSVAGGFALGQASQAFVGRQALRGPGPSPDWQTTFVPRLLATYATTTPFGVTGASGGSVAGGFANAMQLGVSAAVGGSVAGGYAISGSISTGAAFGGSVAGGFARYIVVSAIGGSVAGGYASPALFNFISLGEAIEILANAGFTVNPIIIWQYSTAVPYYYIIGQLPTAGTVIPYQSQPVQLTVSAGPPPPIPPLITVPNVTGLPLTYAIQAIGLSMLNIGTISYIQSSTTPPNQVTSQTPNAGNSVEQYTGINLIVCSGPVMDTLIGDPYTVPNVTN